MKILVVTVSKTTVNPKFSRFHSDVAKGLLEQEGISYDWLVLRNDFPLDHNLNTARKMVLEDDYAALLSLEDDIVLHDQHGIAKLVDRLEDADIALAPYRARPGAYGYPDSLCLLTEANSIVSFNLESMVRYYKLLRWGPFRVAGGGLGCTLISRRILERTDFPKGNFKETDIRFFTKVHELGGKVMCVPIDIGHWDDGLKEELRINDKWFEDLTDLRLAATMLARQELAAMRDTHNKESPIP